MASAPQDRLRTHFASAPPSTHPARWDALWQDGSFLPWDRGHASPALLDLLRASASASLPPVSNTSNPSPAAPNTPFFATAAQTRLPLLPPPVKPDGSRARVLIPGCGIGYDVALFAAMGYDAVGLEVSAHAGEAAKRYLADVGEGPLEGEYRVDEKVGRGSMVVLVGDFFEDAWVGEGGFNVIYDITFLCALPYSLRPRWAARMVTLLAPSGALICLEFPTHKPASTGGPPWSLPATVHAELLKQPGEPILYDDNDVVVVTDRPESETALVRVAHYVPRRTHKAGTIEGVVRDSVSVWRHKS